MSEDPKQGLKDFLKLKESLTEFQKGMHFPTGPIGDVTHKDNVVRSIFYTQYRKGTWYSQVLVKSSPKVIEGAQSNSVGQDVQFILSSDCHGLMYSLFCQELPSIQMKQGYLGKWTHNVGTNVITGLQLKFNEDLLQTHNSVSIDQYFQSMLPEAHRNSHNKDIGNVPELQEFSRILPRYQTRFILPLFYSKDPSSFFPLYFCGALDTLSVVINIRRNYSDLLHVIDEEKKGAFLKASSDNVAVVGGKETTSQSFNGLLSYPQIYNQNLFLSDIECEHNRCSGEDSKSPYKTTINYEDIIINPEENPCKLGKALTIPIKTTGFPVVSVGWCARNDTAYANGYYSNYTTNTYDHSFGYSPIDHSTLDTGYTKPLFKTPSFITEGGINRQAYNCAPSDNGFNFWSMSAKVNDFNAKPGIVIKEGSLKVQLTDTNPWIGVSKGVSSSTDDYTVFCVMTVTKALNVLKFPASDDARKTERGIIVTSGSS